MFRDLVSKLTLGGGQPAGTGPTGLQKSSGRGAGQEGPQAERPGPEAVVLGESSLAGSGCR